MRDLKAIIEKSEKVATSSVKKNDVNTMTCCSAAKKSNEVMV